MRQRDSKIRFSMRGGALTLAVAVVLAFLALNVHADPIQDGAIAPYRAGWFANRGTCVDTCKAKAPGTLAEYEASPVSVTKRAFLCRVAGKPEGDIRTWLYGNQFDDRAACYTTGLDLKGSHSEKYYCLCVNK